LNWNESCSRLRIDRFLRRSGIRRIRGGGTLQVDEECDQAEDDHERDCPDGLAVHFVSPFGVDRFQNGKAAPLGGFHFPRAVKASSRRMVAAELIECRAAFASPTTAS
jgi:hypothetical protein